MLRRIRRARHRRRDDPRRGCSRRCSPPASSSSRRRTSRRATSTRTASTARCSCLSSRTMRERLDVVELDGPHRFSPGEARARAGLLLSRRRARRGGARRDVPEPDRRSARRADGHRAARPRRYAFPRRSTASRASPSTSFAAALWARQTISPSPNASIRSSSIISRALGEGERNEAGGSSPSSTRSTTCSVKLIASAAAEPAELYSGARRRGSVRIRTRRLAPDRDALGRLSRRAARRRGTLRVRRPRRFGRNLAGAPSRFMPASLGSSREPDCTCHNPRPPTPSKRASSKSRALMCASSARRARPSSASRKRRA